jgi:anti-sigma factor RsiW
MSHLGHRLSALIDGELGVDERDRALVHLARCEDCRAEAAALRALKRRMTALGEAGAMDDGLASRLMRLAPPGGPGLARWGYPMAAGAAGSPVLHGLRRTGTDGTSVVPEARGGSVVRSVAAAGAVLVLAGVGVAAFMAGGQQRPEPKITPAVDTYMVQHDLTTGVVPVAPTPASLLSNGLAVTGRNSAPPAHIRPEAHPPPGAFTGKMTSRQP